ncbi:hypothetical protein MCOR27_001409 [Pyricularia oryzae]|nr:hypothetical protein MCOR01_010317 [Pyricularia oryzae]KAI6255693.1 hypothetical protein MCOR19_007842 [Pyricularia oryzae]KAI6287508.1 hypothetical protein MCOR27_001409 [Pyricularia oryzae]KAI6348954.1 hypothetical protein MCOR30_000221 [Pyricularia oryzae]KAI6364360.1 hypothetical protein MCOR31_007470 [Pyricularia oryzae]
MTDITSYKFNHTMLKVKDPKASIAFYKHLGMDLLSEYKVPDHKLELYFVAGDSAISASHGTHQSDREGVLELSYSYGIENTSGGDQEPRGLRPVCLSVDNVQTTCKALCDAGYRINCNSEEETAHVLDPDGFWIKLVAHRSLGRIDDTATADYKGSKVHHTMIGVRDKNVSRKFYEQVFGMTWKYEQHSTQAGRDRFLLGCGKPHTSGPSVDISKPDVKCEGLLELLCIEDTKNKDGMKHHNGNLKPDDPGHICISVDDIHAACERLESLGVQWQKRLMDGPFRVAFIHDPDGNLIEIIQNEMHKPVKHEA